MVPVFEGAKEIVGSAVGLPDLDGLTVGNIVGATIID